MQNCLANHWEKPAIAYDQRVQANGSNRKSLASKKLSPDYNSQREFLKKIGIFTNFECEAVDKLKRLMQAALIGKLEPKYFKRMIIILENNKELLPYLDSVWGVLAETILFETNKFGFLVKKNNVADLNQLIKEFRVQNNIEDYQKDDKERKLVPGKNEKSQKRCNGANTKTGVYADKKLLGVLLFLCDQNKLTWSAWKKKSGISKPTIRKIEMMKNDGMRRESLENIIRPFPGLYFEMFLELIFRITDKDARCLTEEFQRTKRHSKQSEVQATQELLAVILKLCGKHGLLWEDWRNQLNSQHVYFKIRNCDGSYIHPELLERIFKSFGLSKEEILKMIKAMSHQESEVLLKEFEKNIVFGKNGRRIEVKVLDEAFCEEKTWIENTPQLQYYIKQKIKRRGVSVAAAAGLMKVGRKHLKELLEGVYPTVTGTILNKIAAGLGMPTDQLMREAQQISLSLDFTLKLRNSRDRKFIIPIFDKKKARDNKKIEVQIILPFSREIASEMLVDLLKESAYENCGIVPVAGALRLLIAEFCCINGLSIEGLKDYMSGYIVPDVLEGRIGKVHISFVMRVAQIYSLDIIPLIEQAEKIKKQNGFYEKNSIVRSNENNSDYISEDSETITDIIDEIFESTWSYPINYA